ncbi:MAG: hypothetical protein EA420_09010 [Candidatus Competibacteraceae bacterium]|nr:MAG: hypothetical protein EA420_09010 [Candidatus Competibacteraceae bacterium]
MENSRRPSPLSGRRATQRLLALAAGLAQDSGIRIAVRDAPTWSWDPQQHVLVVARDTLDQLGPAQCAGLVAHEIGHCLVSRYHRFDRSEWPTWLGSELMNALEESRAEGFISARFPGVRAWLESLNEREDPAFSPDLPWIALFALACVVEPRHHWVPLPHPLPAEVQDALTATRTARRRYMRTVPKPDWSLDDRVPIPHHDLPADPPANAPTTTPRERVVLAHAWQAYLLARRTILPVAMRLYQQDVDHLARGLASNPTWIPLAQQALALGIQPLIWTIVQLGLRQGRATPAPQPAADALMRLSVALLERSTITDPPAVATTPGSSPPAAARATVAPRPSPVPESGFAPATGYPGPMDYRELLDRHLVHIDHLVHRIEAILEPQRNPALQAGFASGTHLNLRHAMACEFDPREYTRLWMRRSLPQAHDLTAFLLVDLSGSMARANRIEAATVGLLILAEVLERIPNVRWAAAGFQDEIIPIADFHEGLTAAVQRRFEHLRGEVHGRNPGGHNQPSYNDDGPAVRHATRRLLERPSTRHLLIAISDGLPEGRHSTEEDLRQAIREASQADVQVVGVGIGEHTDHVANFYPHHLARVPIDDFPRRMAAMIERLLLP